MELEVIGLDGNPKRKINVDDEIFGIEYNNDLVYKALVAELSNARQGTASTKTRGEVSGGGRKPWRQKGTGRARHGSIRSPIWVGGGIAQGPKPRDYTTKLPKKMKRKAFFSVLSAKIKNNELIVVEDFSMDKIKTKEFVKIFSNILSKINSGYGLLVLPTNDKNIILSSRNIPTLKSAIYNSLSIRDLFYSSKVIFLESAIKKYQELYKEKV